MPHICSSMHWQAGLAVGTPLFPCCWFLVNAVMLPIHGSFESAPKQHLDWFSHFCRVHSVDQHRQTAKPCYSKTCSIHAPRAIWADNVGITATWLENPFNHW